MNLIFLTSASLCVGFALGWVVARPRRWGSFGGQAGRDREDWLAGDGHER